MSKRLSVINHMTAGFSAVLIGYTSSVAIIIQAATAAGASPAQIESWLLVLGLGMGLTSIGFSWFYKTPVLTAWSTPGAAILISAASQYEMPAVIGAFVVSGLLIFLTGLVTPIARAIQRIPAPLATAMLGAILMPFCVRAFLPVSSVPAVFIAVFVAYVLARRFAPKYTMLVLLIVGFVCAGFMQPSAFSWPDLSVAEPVWVTPGFTLSAVVNISLPLYLVTMLSQNLPGIAMMRSYEFEVPVKPVLLGTGLMNVVTAPLGGFSFNLAAISAAICLNEDVDSNKNKRYRAVLWAGGFYLLAGLLASSVVTLFLSFPAEVLQMLVGFALLGTLLMCLQSAFNAARYREPALLTFLVTLSGVSYLGVSATLWGLVTGWLYLTLMKKHK